MDKILRKTGTIAGCIMMLVGCAGIAPPAQTAGNMTFFVTSIGSGKGANLGGLEGADQRCQELAKAAGSDQRTWHAYLST